MHMNVYLSLADFTYTFFFSGGQLAIVRAVADRYILPSRDCRKVCRSASSFCRHFRLLCSVVPHAHISDGCMLFLRIHAECERDCVYVHIKLYSHSVLGRVFH